MSETAGEAEVAGRAAGGRVQSVERAVALLEAAAEAPPPGRPGAELATACGLNRATAWRLLATLEDHGLVERDPVTNRYAVGHAVSRMAANASVAGLVRRARPTLEAICAASGETANLAVPRRLGLTYVDEVAPRSVLAARWLGHHVPVHATSAGKALLAWLPESEVETFLSAPLAEFTPTTRTDREQLRAELADIRNQGYSVAVGELEAEVYGVSAPVLDARQRPFAVISVWGPRDRVPPSRFAELGPLVLRGAAEINHPTQ
ncbi:MAG: IclR family transcriptional regulator [Streptosporangiales bacterium]